MNISTITKLITTPLSERLVRAAMRTMRPIVRMFAPYMTADVFLDLCERVYVEECDRMLKSPRLDPATRARLSANVGYHTRAVKELLETPGYFTDQDVCIEGMILSFWISNAMFRDAQTGEAANLRVVGPGATFQNLVRRSVGKEVPVLDVLDTLIARGNVERVYPDSVRLKSPYYEVLEEDEEPYIDTGSFAIANLTQTVLHNLDNRRKRKNKRVQHQRWSVALPRERVGELRQKLNHLLRQQTKEASLTIRDCEDPGMKELNQVFLGVGYYMWEENSTNQGSEIAEHTEETKNLL